MEYIASGRRGQTYVGLIERALTNGPYTHICGAVAYATVGGVKLLEEIFTEDPRARWEQMNKRWLVGIDWCRSDPPALDRLGALAHSEVKVPDGEAVVTAAGCTP